MMTIFPPNTSPLVMELLAHALSPERWADLLCGAEVGKGDRGAWDLEILRQTSPFQAVAWDWFMEGHPLKVERLTLDNFLAYENKPLIEAILQEETEHFLGMAHNTRDERIIQLVRASIADIHRDYMNGNLSRYRTPDAPFSRRDLEARFGFYFRDIPELRAIEIMRSLEVSFRWLHWSLQQARKHEGTRARAAGCSGRAAPGGLLRRMNFILLCKEAEEWLGASPLADWKEDNHV